ncbi:hypothetical protein ACFLSA_05595 [Bacteroidota bacterium]
MASLKDLKKDINNLMYEVISECYTHMEYSPETDFKNVDNIISEAVNIRNELIKKVNDYPYNSDKASRKKYLIDIVIILYDKNIELIDRLNQLNS